jgi:Leucine-rich repeat (LRR) protein
LIKVVNFTQNKRLWNIAVSGNKLTKIDVSQNLRLSLLQIANNPISTLDLAANRNIDVIDIRRTKITKLDLRRLPVCSLDARNTSVTVFVDDPKQAKLDWQTTIDANVRIFARPSKSVKKQDIASSCYLQGVS